MNSVSKTMTSESKSDLVENTGSEVEPMRRVYLVDVLSIVFGIGTWVVVNGLWVELPLLVQAMPEGWNLPSYITIIVQLANIAPLTYSVLHSIYPKLFSENRVIYFVIFLGLLSNGLLVFYWDTTVYFLGQNRSVALLGLAFCLGMVDTSSRVLYLPFMAHFNSMYLTSFFIGEGLSGFVPSIFALIQGVGGNPECLLVNVTTDGVTEEKLESVTPDPFFSVEVFFVLLFITVLASLVAFHLLTLQSLTAPALANPLQSRRESPTEVLLNVAEPPASFYQSTSPTSSIDNVDEDDSASDKSSASAPNIASADNNGNVENKSQHHHKAPLFHHVGKSVFIYLLTVQAVVCAFAHGVFPSIQSFSSLPYGNVAYHWSAVLSTMANPAVCFLLFVLPKPTKVSITSVLVASLAVGMYVMATAVQSPNPPLVGETSGEILMVLGWTLLAGCFTYVKVSVATVLRAEGKRGLFWCGAITQAGAAVGALATFFVVNQTTIFNGYYPCQDQNSTTETTEDPTRNLLIET